MKLYNALSYSIGSDLRYYGDFIRRPLVSYHAIKQTNANIVRMVADKRFQGKYFLDSGGFSAFTQGVKINIDEYIAFIRTYKDLFVCYANLDDIRSARLTKDNQTIMEEAGLSPLPVFHSGEDVKILIEMCQKYDYICLGGLVPLAKKKPVLRNWLDICYSITTRTKTKTHLFGISGKDMLQEYPCYSADSTSAFEGSRRGSITNLFTKEKGDPRKSLKAFTTMDKSATDKQYKKRVIHMMEQTQAIEDFITKLWAHRGIVWKD